MFNNVGAKIKGLVSIISAIGIILNIFISGAIFFFIKESGGDTIIGLIAGCTVLVLTCFIWWLAMIVFYAFGELVHNSTKIRKLLEEEQKTGNKKTHSVDDKLTKLKEWRKKGLITEEEYNKKISEI